MTKSWLQWQPPLVRPLLMQYIRLLYLSDSLYSSQARDGQENRFPFSLFTFSVFPITITFFSTLTRSPTMKPLEPELIMYPTLYRFIPQPNRPAHSKQEPRLTRNKPKFKNWWPCFLDHYQKNTLVYWPGAKRKKSSRKIPKKKKFFFFS